MSEDTKVTFVNGVMGRGILNNVVNLQLGVLLFNPSPDGKGVELAMTTNCRLRMDRMCAQQLYETLGELMQATAAQEAEKLPGEAPIADAKRPN